MEEHVLKHVRTFCDVVTETEVEGGEEGCGSGVDVSKWTSRLTFDVMGDIAFGRTFEVLRDSTNRYIP